MLMDPFERAPANGVAQELRAAALEEAGRRLDLLARGARDDGDEAAACVLDDAATEVRSLKEAR